MEELQKHLHDTELIQTLFSPKINIDSALQKLLSEANIALGRLSGNIELIKEIELYAFLFLLKESVSSCSIDEEQISFYEVLKKYLNVYDLILDKNVNYVLNYSTTLNIGHQLLKEQNISLDFIKKLHKNLLMGIKNSNVMPGEFRRGVGWNESLIKNSTSYVHPANRSLLSGLEAFQKFITCEHEYPVLITAAYMHVFFLRLKPFLSDNGKIARMLILHYLYKTQLLKLPLLCMSEIFYKHKADYMNKIASVYTQDGLEGWVKYFLRAFIASTEKTINILKMIQRMKESDYSLIKSFGRSTVKGNIVLNYLFEYPLVRIKDIEKITGLKNPNALALMAKFQRMNIVCEITGQKRNRIFAYKRYIDLFLN